MDDNERAAERAAVAALRAQDRCICPDGLIDSDCRAH